MEHVRILDCTLRDGGYCNEWNFGFSNIKKILNGLKEAGIDIIECGFLTNKVKYEKNGTRYNTIEELTEFVPKEKQNKPYVAMINYGEYDISQLPVYDGTSIDGIRVAFHKKDFPEAIKICEQIKEKGYLVFIQAMVSLNYTDEEFLALIRASNQLEPYAFYIVDSFGVMKRKDLIRLFYLVENNLKTNIYIGYHSHNNLQLAYANAQALVDIQTKRDIIIDSTIFGMGRGAGNLNTELFLQYLNDNIGTNYQVKPLLRVMDETLNNIYQENFWGYSLPNYLSAVHNCHPTYASYLDERKTLTVEDLDEIFSMMEETKKNHFDQKYADEIYKKYMEIGETQEDRLEELKRNLKDKKVLIIAPGKSAEIEKEKVIACAKKGRITISINFDYPYLETDYIFLSNLRRYREIEASKLKKAIVTSNIPAREVYLKTDYESLLNENNKVKDNAGLLLMKYLIELGVKEIEIAGMDGYGNDSQENYAKQEMIFIASKKVYQEMNEGINNILKELKKQIKIQFITTPHFIKIT